MHTQNTTAPAPPASDKRGYHSALVDEEYTDESRIWWAEDGNSAFVHDFANGLPPEFLEADFIYGEPPWKDGYDEFNIRAGKLDAEPFEVVMYRLNCALASLSQMGKPWMVLVGHASARSLGCEWMIPCRLNGSLAALMGAGGPPPPPEFRDTEKVVHWIASNPDYNIIADFCAGYGRTAQAAVEHGKKFIATDFNPKCIARIANGYHEWLG